MKKIRVLVLAIILAIPAAVWAQLPVDSSSLLLVKKGQLMKLTYENAMTPQAAEMSARFKRFGWRDPAYGECIPERPDIEVAVDQSGMHLSYSIIRNGQKLRARGSLAADYPYWRVADSVMYYADKFRPCSLLHSPKP